MGTGNDHMIRVCLRLWCARSRCTMTINIFIYIYTYGGARHACIIKHGNILPQYTILYIQSEDANTKTFLRRLLLYQSHEIEESEARRRRHRNQLNPHYLGSGRMHTAHDKTLSGGECVCFDLDDAFIQELIKMRNKLIVQTKSG